MLAFTLVCGLLASCGRRTATATSDQELARSTSELAVAVSASVPPLVDLASPGNARHGDGAGERPSDVLGNIPPDGVSPTLRTRVLFQIGDQVHSANELAEIAMGAAIKQGGQVSREDLTIYVTIRTIDDGGVLADVVVGHGIGKPCWLVTIDRKMQVVKCQKSIGRG